MYIVRDATGQDRNPRIWSPGHGRGCGVSILSISWRGKTFPGRPSRLGQYETGGRLRRRKRLNSQLPSRHVTLSPWCETALVAIVVPHRSPRAPDAPVRFGCWRRVGRDRLLPVALGVGGAPPHATSGRASRPRQRQPAIFGKS